MEGQSPDERTGLLEGYGEQQQQLTDQESAPVASKHSTKPAIAINGRVAAGQVLPLALLAALAMAATAATTIFAYASLLCTVPTKCRNAERNVYAGTVAVATLIANGCGLLFLGALARLARHNHEMGLKLWFALRSMSVVMLAVGCASLSAPPKRIEASIRHD